MLRSPRFWIPMASLCGVLWVLFLDMGRTSPGPISRTHAQEPELAEASSCDTCHGSVGTSLARACGSCHAEIEEDREHATGFHGTLVGVDVEDCGLCHKEHHGLDRRLVDDKSYVLAGFDGPAAYDHAPLDFTLEGRHAELVCKDCHANAEAELLAPGETRFAGLDRACVACHEDVHEGRIVRECAACHGQAHPFAEVAVFAHASFPCEGAHHDVACDECHQPDGDRSVEALAGADPPAGERACLDCHESPHQPSFLAQVADLSATSAGESCELCHTTVHEGFVHAEGMPAELHAASGFPLDAPHDRAACADCHQPVGGDALASFEERYPGRTADECRACHEDVHGGQFDHVAMVRRKGCLACHERHGFQPSTFDVAQHAATSFPLVASHEAVACDSCHQEVHADEPRVFHGTPADCASCHADAHRGRLADVEDCSRCHEPTVFSEYHADAFDHGRSTSFELDGAHARLDCDACHRPSAGPDELGRTLGFATEVFGEDVQLCSTCHADPHDGLFDREEVPETFGGRVGCARCHVTESFHQPALASFDHELWTGYPMAEFHADLACAACHTPRRGPDGQKGLGPVAGTSCADCHTDPHAGQFAVGGRTDCARCHLDAGGMSFDHQDSRFPLDQRHASLECAACHQPWPLPGGGEAVRYRPLGTECSDCHGPKYGGGR